MVHVIVGSLDGGWKAGDTEMDLLPFRGISTDWEEKQTDNKNHNNMVRKQLCRKGCRKGPGRQVEKGIGMCPCGNER